MVFQFGTFKYWSRTYQDTQKRKNINQKFRKSSIMPRDWGFSQISGRKPKFFQEVKRCVCSFGQSSYIRENLVDCFTKIWCSLKTRLIRFSFQHVNREKWYWYFSEIHIYSLLALFVDLIQLWKYWEKRGLWPLNLFWFHLVFRLSTQCCAREITTGIFFAQLQIVWSTFDHC